MAAVLEVLNKMADYLGGRGVENARLNAELLLAHVLGCGRLDLYLRFDEPVEESRLAALRPLARRRGRREPLAYVLGKTEFFGLQLRADPRALIPRPETEELAGLVVETASVPPGEVLDLGTGSGALALALARHWPEARVTAAEVCPEALALAKENAARLNLAERVRFAESDWFGNLPGAFDLIVSNPPYLSEEEWKDAAPEIREHEPRRALEAGKDGLACLKPVLYEARRYLKPGGWAALETGTGHHEALEETARRAGYTRWETRRDLCRRPRFFLAWL